MPENADEARQTVLAEAAALWATGDGEVVPPGDPALGAAVGDLPGFLDAYYRLAATEDLTTAGPERVAAVAAWHAALGASRPQGRAAVEVRDSGKASLTGAGTVIDIVTDDMPTWSTRSRWSSTGIRPTSGSSCTRCSACAET